MTTKELSAQTFADYERFFERNGHGGCGCMRYRRGRALAPPGGTSGKRLPSRDLRREQNLSELWELVRQGRARGVLVYGFGEVVGWCQYGRAEDLPIEVTRRTPADLVAADVTSDWRITCFLTLPEHRRKGVATLALAVAVQSIRRSGGGWIEARPVVHCHHDPELARARRGLDAASPELAERLQLWPVRNVPRVGWVRAAETDGRAAPHRGTMSMFERLGFVVTRRDGETGVLMRLHV
ncbi:MAG TPA: hypothetical protein VK020_00065 [Microlunatus sp.]|nr:hypothetical protein [Microlunatus sp.]